MSEIIDSLKQSEPNQFQEELAKTYFSSSPSKDNHFTQFQPTSKNKKTQRFFLGILLGLIGLFFVVLFIFNRIEIDINILPSFKIPSTENKNTDVIYLNKEGEVNREIIKDIVFYENSDIESKWGKDLILLSNEVGSKMAVLGINFNKPLDMKENLLRFYAKGKVGGEDLRISLRDDKNNFCHSKINQLGNSWQQFVIDIEQAKDFIDPERIIHIDFEVNPAGRQNSYRSSVYFKDITLIKREG